MQVTTLGEKSQVVFFALRKAQNVGTLSLVISLLLLLLSLLLLFLLSLLLLLLSLLLVCKTSLNLTAFGCFLLKLP